VNKNDLIQRLSDHTGLAKTDAAKAVDGVFDLIAAALKEGDEVRLTGFGVFVVATRAGGKGRPTPKRSESRTGRTITYKTPIDPKAARRQTQLERRTQAQDHPILLTVPETHYLKCLVLEAL